ncbi:MAG: glycoside hydrolase family 36 N-terminal domain-containing protein, partial [Pirellulales bacterium]
MNVKRLCALVLVAHFCVGYAAFATRAADVTVDADGAGWSVSSGTNSLRLRRNGDALYLAWLGPTGDDSESWQAPLLNAVIEGNAVRPEDLRVERVRTEQRDDRARIIATLKHATLPVEVEVACVGWSDTGVFWNEITLSNTGTKPLAVQDVSSLALNLPGGKAELRYLDGPWPTERQLKSVQVGRKGIALSNSNIGHSTRDISTWWSLFTRDTDLS